MTGFSFRRAQLNVFILATCLAVLPARAQDELILADSIPSAPPILAATPIPSVAPRRAPVRSAPARNAPTRNHSSRNAPAGPQLAAPRWEPFRLIVPAIGLDSLVVRGVDDDTLRAGPGHDPLSDRPGEKGNCVVAAHRNVHGAPFWYLTKLTPNTLVLVETARETLTYKVAFSRVTPETETSLLERPSHPLTAPQLTLYTCTLPKSTNRFIVVANLMARDVHSALPLHRKATFPTVTSGPLHLLKDPNLRKQLRLPPLPPKIKPVSTRTSSSKPAMFSAKPARAMVLRHR